jgi:DNA polymerase-1
MIHLIDASIYVFRAWFSIPEDMTDPEGRPVNAAYGYARFLGDLLEREKPDRLAAAFDESLTKSFRTRIYPAYKANRESSPPELKRQFAICRELTELLGVAQFAHPEYEADDIIGTLCEHMRKKNIGSVIISRDKDLAQLLREGDQFWNTIDGHRHAYDDVAAKFGAQPERMADYQALVGDKVDNIEGVPGVGAKTAGALMEAFGSLEEIFDKLDAVAELPIRGAASLGGKLEAHKEKAFLARRLTRIAVDMPLEYDDSTLIPQVPRLDELLDLYDRLGFGDGLRWQAKRLAMGG